MSSHRVTKKAYNGCIIQLNLNKISRMKKTITIAIAFVIFSPNFAYIAAAQTKPLTNDGSTQSAPIDTTCITNALQLREDSISAAFSTFATTQSQLLTARKTGLVESYTKPTARERADARKSVWSTFKIASKTNHENLKTARKKAWDTYRPALRSCKGGRAETKYDQHLNGSATESL